MVNCKICDKKFKAITNSHLKKHGIALNEYQKVYGPCETQTNTGRTHFKMGHSPWNTGKERSEETKKKISETNKGRGAWNKGKRLSKEHKNKLSSAHKGKIISKDIKRKISLSLKGHKGYWKGKKMSEKHKQKLSLARKGRKNLGSFQRGHSPWNKGKKLDDGTKKKISEANKGGKWINEEYRMKMRKVISKKWKEETFVEKVLSGMIKSTKIKPNKLEKQMIKIVVDNNLPFNFVGDGKFWIRDKKTSYNPDFIHNDKNQRKIIEVFGKYWHNRNEHKIRDMERIKTYKEKGFGVLIIWEDDIKEAKENVIKQINNFLKNGIQKQS